jgi:hypothetical protein
VTIPFERSARFARLQFGQNAEFSGASITGQKTAGLSFAKWEV